MILMPSLEPKDRMTKRSLLLKRIWRWMNRGRKLKRKRRNGLIKRDRRRRKLLKKEDESKSEVKVEDDKFKVPLLPQPSHKKLIILKTNRSISNENKTDVSINNFFSPEICKKHFLNASALKQDLSLSASKLLTSFDSTKTSINNTTANTTLKKRIVLKMNTSSNSPSNNVTPKRVDYLSEMLKSANKNKNQSKF